jgi:HSP20 family protein
MISGEIKEETRDESDRFHAFERVCGRFSRSFTLPEGADPDKLRAELRDGVLHVNIPKQPGTQAKRIPVEAGQGKEEQAQEQQVKVQKAA